ncbi:Rha family transcriptional regulator [Maridesulfovibrio sp. FT414]|uniref:Rha family transcriptional regulator n=1 Tax=Maridesulfovibrio sp. FT414 TaxID=2979469 RepID=UPI003D800B68
MIEKSNENKEVKAVVELVVNNNQPMVSSLVVAELFEKMHKNVLQSINELEIPDDFRQLNFQPSSYINSQNKEQPAFNMTRDGFSLLAMGFTGKKSMEWKIKFLEAFNAMEARLSTPQVEAKLTIKKANPEAIAAFTGFARYWCYLENISWQEGKRQIEAAMRIQDICDMDALTLNSAWTYITLCRSVVPPKLLGSDPCSSEDLSPVNGLLDYWAHCGAASREELVTNLCNKMRIESLGQIPKAYLHHAVSLVWEGINCETGLRRALKEASA